MANILDFTKFTFSAEQIRAVNELLFDEVLKSDEINNLVTFYPGIVYDKEIGFIGRGGLVGVKGQGCDPTPQAWSINTRKAKWTPKQWEVLIESCAKDLEPTAAVYSLKTGVRYFDFTDTDYMNIVLEVLANSMKEFIIRLVFFNDVDIQNFASGGILKDGIDIQYFNVIDGLFKQYDIQATANPAQKVAIAENLGSTYAAQALDPNAVRDTYLPLLIDGADDRIEQLGNDVIFCTKSFYKAYKKSLRGTELETMLTILRNGVKTLEFDGKALLPIPTWDDIIKKYFNNGTKLVNPHRAVYTSKDVLAFGVDSEGSFDEFDTWYNKDTRKVKIEASGKADVELLNPELFMIAI